MTVEVLVHIYLQTCQSKKFLIGQIVFIFISFKVMNTTYNIKHEYNINFFKVNSCKILPCKMCLDVINLNKNDRVLMIDSLS